MWSITPTHAEFGLSGKEFSDAYLSRLQRYGADRIAKSLESIGWNHKADRLVLCCFEAELNRCHRGDLAAWWLGQTGEDTAELT